MIQGQSQFWQQAQPLPLVVPLPVNSDLPQMDSTALPVTDAAIALPSKAAESGGIVPEDYEWLTLL